MRPTDADRKGRPADAGRGRSRPAAPSIDRLERSALLANDASEGLGMLYYIFLGYLTLICLGIAALKSPGTMTRGNELAYERAVFTSVNVATLTGFQLNVGPGQFSPTSLVGPATFVALTLGGVLFALNAGGMAAVRILRMPYTDAQVLAASTVSTCMATLAGTTFLIGPGRGIFDAMLLALSSFGNSGIFVGRLPSTESWQAHVGMMPLALFGALGLPVLMDVYELIIAGRPLTRHSRVAIRTTAALYLVSIVVLTVSRGEFWANLFVGFSQHGWYPSQGRAMRDAVISSSLQAVNARGAGFPFEYAGTLPRLTQWLLIGLMLIGGNSAGTAGGLKATTLVELFGGVRDALGGRGPPVLRCGGDVGRRVRGDRFARLLRAAAGLARGSERQALVPVDQRGRERGVIARFAIERGVGVEYAVGPDACRPPVACRSPVVDGGDDG